MGSRDPWGLIKGLSPAHRQCRSTLPALPHFFEVSAVRNTTVMFRRETGLEQESAQSYRVPHQGQKAPRGYGAMAFTPQSGGEARGKRAPEILPASRGAGPGPPQLPGQDSTQA